MKPDFPADDRYKLLKKLGEGGMGTVFLAEDRQLNRQVALKILDGEDQVITDQYQRRFIREFEVCSKLRHENIVKILDFGRRPGGSFYYAMELLDCTDLYELLKEIQGGLQAERVSKILLQILDGLETIHQAGVIHRDLKPANIMLDKNDRAVIMDFGLVMDNSMTRMTETGVMLGTPNYMSPEMILGLDTDCRSNLYQLGVISHDLLTGKKLFSDRKIQTLLIKITSGHRTFAAGLTKDWKSVIEKSTALSAADRYQSASEMAEAIKEIVRTPEPELALPTPLAAKKRFPCLLCIFLLLSGLFLATVIGNEQSVAPMRQLDEGLTGEAREIEKKKDRLSYEELKVFSDQLLKHLRSLQLPAEGKQRELKRVTASISPDSFFHSFFELYSSNKQPQTRMLLLEKVIKELDGKILQCSEISRNSLFPLKLHFVPELLSLKDSDEILDECCALCDSLPISYKVSAAYAQHVSELILLRAQFYGKKNKTVTAEALNEILILLIRNPVMSAKTRRNLRDRLNIPYGRSLNVSKSIEEFQKELAQSTEKIKSQFKKSNKLLFRNRFTPGTDRIKKNLVAASSEVAKNYWKFYAALFASPFQFKELCYFYKCSTTIHQNAVLYRMLDFGPSMDFPQVYRRLHSKVLCLIDLFKFEIERGSKTVGDMDENICKYLTDELKLGENTAEATEHYWKLIDSVIQRLPDKTLLKNQLSAEKYYYEEKYDLSLIHSNQALSRAWIIEKSKGSSTHLSAVENVYELRWKLLRHHCKTDLLEKEALELFKKCSELLKKPQFRNIERDSSICNLQFEAAANLCHIGIVDRSRKKLFSQYKEILGQLKGSDNSVNQDMLATLLRGAPLNKFH